MKWTWFRNSLVTCEEDGSVSINAKCIMYFNEKTNGLELPDDNSARLIAAAPELLEACREFLECGQNAGHNIYLLVRIKNAVTKAEGT